MKLSIATTLIVAVQNLTYGYSWTTTPTGRGHIHRLDALADTTDLDYDEAGFSARALLYEDLQNARAKAAEEEGKLLVDRVTDFLAPLETTLEGAAASPLPKKPKPTVRQGGTGFAGGGGAAKKTKTERKLWQKSKSKLTPKDKQTLHQAAALRADGCLRIDGAISKSTAARVKACILREINNAAEEVQQDPIRTNEINAMHGIDQQRTNRCVINLPFRADRIKGYREACQEADTDFDKELSGDSILDALQELLNPVDGALGPLYRELLGEDAPLYELCSLVTWPGSFRQSVHPDAAYQPNAPLYAAFVACQDITIDMGPTLFLPGTHLPTEERQRFDNEATRSDMVANFAAPKQATLTAGDLAIFDMRCLHVGQANHPEKGASRALFNVTFRNPKATEDIGYDGSVRKPYFDQFTLGDIQAELERGQEAFDAWQ